MAQALADVTQALAAAVIQVWAAAVQTVLPAISLPDPPAAEPVLPAHFLVPVIIPTLIGTTVATAVAAALRKIFLQPGQALLPFSIPRALISPQAVLFP